MDSNLESNIETLNDVLNNLFIHGTTTLSVPTSNTQCDVTTTTVTLPKTLSNSNYTVLLTLQVINSFSSYDGNYDIEVIVSDKTINSFKISLHRGTEKFLGAGGIWYVDYLVIP